MKFVKFCAPVIFLFGCTEPTPEDQCMHFANAVCTTASRCWHPDYGECIELYMAGCSEVSDAIGPVEECKNAILFGYPTCLEQYPPDICEEIKFTGFGGQMRLGDYKEAVRTISNMRTYGKIYLKELMTFAPNPDSYFTYMIYKEKYEAI